MNSTDRLHQLKFFPAISTTDCWHQPYRHVAPFCTDYSVTVVPIARTKGTDSRHQFCSLSSSNDSGFAVVTVPTELTEKQTLLLFFEKGL